MPNNDQFQLSTSPSEMIWVADYPARGAMRFPERAAIIGDHGTLTYAELHRSSLRFASYLAGLGLPRASRVAYLGKNSEMFFPVMFGCMLSGHVLVPINWRCVDGEIAYILDDAEVRLLIVANELQELAVKSVAKSGGAIPLLPVESQGEGASLEGIFSTNADLAITRRCEADDCVLQMYTSGTTGSPKGVMLSHRNVSVARWVEMGLSAFDDWSDKEIVYSAMPNFHIGGLSWVLIALMRSLTCVVSADPSPQNMQAMSVRHGATRTFIVAPLVRAVLDVVVASGEAPPPFKTIYYGAAPMDPALIQRCIEVFGCGFHQYFGMTEACGSITYLPPAEHDLAHPEILRSVGRALPGYALEIRDLNATAMPPGVAGEIWVKSDAVMLGYWKRPEATAGVLVNGWYRTGDGGYIDENGYLFLTDRIKDMVITGGENVYPVEVEVALRSHRAVKEVVVVGMPDPKWGEVVTAVIELRDGMNVTLEDLRTHARPLIAGYKLPKRLDVVEQLPRTATGKLQRALARKQLKFPNQPVNTP